MKKLLVITSYPDIGETHSTKTVGVASYTKTLLEGLIKNDPKWVIQVLGERLPGRIKYQESGIKVQRIWKRNDLVSLIRLFTRVLNEDANKVLVSFEIGLFGGLLSALFGVLGILFLKLLGKQTHILLHQVATDFSGFEKNKFKVWFLNFFSRLFYALLKFSANQIYVFEDSLKEKLGGEKIKVLPHLILDSERIEKTVARKRLGLSNKKTYGLYFGYIAPYKGVDWLVKNWPKNKNLELLVAGGINPNYKNDKKITSFVSRVEEETKGKNIKVTGFVAERDIKLYFSACDFVILPYKMFFSSSGPLAFAFSHKKPVLLSRALADYTRSEDFKKALTRSVLVKKDMLFDFSKQSLAKAVGRLAKNKKKFEVFAEEMGRARSIKKISMKLSKYLNQSAKSL